MTVGSTFTPFVRSDKNALSIASALVLHIVRSSLNLWLETDFMKGHSTFGAVAHEDVFQQSHLHVLINLGNLDAASPRVEIAGDAPLVPVYGNTVEKRVELVP